MIPKPVLITWRDAETSAGGWTCADEAKAHRCPVAHTVGFLLDETDAEYVMALTWSRSRDGGNTETNGGIAIPKSWCDLVLPLSYEGALS